MNVADLVRLHLDEHNAVGHAVADTMAEDVAALAEMTLSTVRAGGTVMFAGNGGSAADAQHLAAEYIVRFARNRRPIAAIALTTDTSVLTATGNDFGFDHVFERQVRALAREGDLLVMHSTSGESENLLRATAAAREVGARTAALLARGGGRLAPMVDLALVVPTDSTARAQEVHLLIGHIICAYVEEAIASLDAAAETT